MIILSFIKKSTFFYFFFFKKKILIYLYISYIKNLNKFKIQILSLNEVTKMEHKLIQIKNTELKLERNIKN